jgi:hypothetical protein
MKGDMYFYRELDKKGLLTKAVIDTLISTFTKKMGYPPEEIVVRRDEARKEIRGMVTRVSRGLPPGHVILYPVIIRQARRFQDERTPV